MLSALACPPPSCPPTDPSTRPHHVTSRHATPTSLESGCGPAAISASSSPSHPSSLQDVSRERRRRHQQSIRSGMGGQGRKSPFSERNSTLSMQVGLFRFEHRSGSPPHAQSRPGSSRQEAAGSRQLAAGSWQQAAGSRKRAAGLQVSLACEPREPSRHGIPAGMAATSGRYLHSSRMPASQSPSKSASLQQAASAQGKRKCTR